MLPQYHLIRLKDGLKTYELKETEVAWVPTISGRSVYNFIKVTGCLGDGTRAVCRYSLMSPSEKAGVQPLAPLEKFVPKDTRNWVHWSNWCLAGAMKVTYTLFIFSFLTIFRRMFDPKSGKMLKELICGHCTEEWSTEKLNIKYGPLPATSV